MFQHPTYLGDRDPELVTEIAHVLDRMDDSLESWPEKADYLIEQLEASGYLLVKTVREVMPQTVHIGYTCDRFEVTYRQGHGFRVFVVDALDGRVEP